MRSILYSIAGFEGGEMEPQAKKCRWCLEAENNPQARASKATGISVLQMQGTKLQQQHEGAWNQIHPHSLQKGRQSC